MQKFNFKSRIANQLIGASFTLIAVCSFSFISPEPAPVGDLPGGGKSITAAEATAMIANFPKWKATSGKKGGYLSKTAINAIFTANPTATGLFWYMGSDVNGNTFNLIVEPGTSTLNGVNTTANTSIFVSETMCPTECGNLGK
ncbi:MAG: hypothetical protein NTV09_11285 [Bacteroidetes bacterium]|nr:hypothetical protein [Bacteroidota bacterium]